MRTKIVKAYIKHNLIFYLSLVICSAICFSSFVTFNHLNSSVEQGLNNYLSDYHYYDGLVQPYFGDFTNEEYEQIKSIPEIDYIRATHIIDFNICNDELHRYIRLIGINLEEENFYYLEKIDDGDIYLSAEFAKLNNYHVGDEIKLNYLNQNISFKIKAIINTPEVLGAMRGVKYSLEQSSLGFAYIDINNLSNLTNFNSYNTIVYYLKDTNDSVIVANKIKDIFNNKQIYFEENDSLIAKNNITNDLNVLSPIATILPLLTYVIGLIISILFIRQFINMKLKDIGILKSNGLSNKYIISLFILYSIGVSIIGSLLGILLSIIQIRIYTNFYTNAMFLPEFTIINNYKVIILAILISLFTSIIAVIFNIKSITKTDILNIINGNNTIEYHNKKYSSNKFIYSKSFLKAISNNPFRFIFSLFNLLFVVIIVVASISVKEAKDNSINYIYEDKINYDYIIHYHSNVSLANNYNNSFKEITLLINNDYYESFYILNNTNYINIYDIKDNLIYLGNGVIISSKLANELNVNIGDNITINDKKVIVDNISKEVTEYKSYMSFNTYQMLFNDNSCNALFIKGDLDDYNINSNDLYYISNVKLLKRDLVNKFEYISNYIIIIIAIISLISIIVIFNMSVIYYKERYREHKILRTIGFSKLRIILYSFIEIIIQDIICLIIGIPIGYLLSKYIVFKINNNFITLYTRYLDIPFISISLFIIIVSIIGRIIASREQIKLVDDYE